MALLTLTVPVPKKSSEHVTSVRLEPLTVVLLILVVVLSVTAVGLATIVYRHRHAAEQRLVTLDEDRNSSASLRTRLSPLHSNLLYALTSDDDKVCHVSCALTIWLVIGVKWFGLSTE